MTTSAWSMLILTWTVVVGFAGRFLWRILTVPPRGEDGVSETSGQRR